MDQLVDKKRVKYLRSLDQIEQLSDAEKLRLKSVTEEYVFRANEYYLNLIDWDDPKDPIRQLIIPRDEELIDWPSLLPPKGIASFRPIHRGTIL